MLKFGNKEFNNLQEQVLVNANSIEELKQSLGTALPNPIAGPQGPMGPQGPQGVAGTHSAWTIGTDLPASANLGDIHLLWNGDVYQYTVNGWVLELNIRGSQGVEGPRGFTGPQGIQGIQGPKGDKGEAGPIFKTLGQLTSISELPDPETVDVNAAYLVNDEIYAVIANEWINLGSVLATTTANSIVSTPVNFIDAENVQDAIDQLSDASYIKVEPYNEEYSSDVSNHLWETTNLAEENAGSISDLYTKVPRVLELNGEILNTNSYVNIGYAPAQLNNYDVLKVEFAVDKELSDTLDLHSGIYYFRKAGIKTGALGVEHIIFEVSYNGSMHDFNEQNISIFIEVIRNQGAVLGYRISPNDSQVVHKTGTESIAGAKTFSDLRVNTTSGGAVATITTDANYIYIGRVGNSQANLLKIDANTGQIPEIGDIAAVLDMINGEA